MFTWPRPANSYDCFAFSASPKSIKQVHSPIMCLTQFYWLWIFQATTSSHDIGLIRTKSFGL